MNTAQTLLTHAWRMLTYEVSTTLRVLMPALVIIFGCSAGAAFLVPDALDVFTTPPDALPPIAPGSIGVVVVLILIGLIGYALMAVLWHRYVLLYGSDRDEALAPDASILLGYIWRAILVGFAQMVAAIPLGVVMGSIVGIQSPTSLFAQLLSLIVTTILFWIGLRLSVVLPAAAMRQPMSLRNSWELTGALKGPLWSVAAFLTLFNVAAYTASGLLLPDTGPSMLLGETFLFTIESLIFIAILTTLYGHLVENRPLDR